jgi:VWFA-related protein
MTRSASAVLVALGVWAVPLAPPGSAQAERDVVTDEISVTAVEIAVQVLQRNEPVLGLERSDFAVYDRGIEQEVVSFEVLDLTLPATAERASGLAASAADPDRARHLLLLFDIDFTDWYELPRAVRGARELVAAQLHASDRLAVGFYSAFYGIQMLTDFVTDREAARLAVDAIGGVVERDPEAAADRLAALSGLTGLTFEGERVDRETWLEVARKWTTTAQQPVGESPEQLMQEWELFDAEIHDPAWGETGIDPVANAATWTTDLHDERILRQVRELGRKLGDLAHRFADLPDPKHVIFLSQGFPSRLIEHPDHTTRVQFRLEEALHAFVETGWVLQAVDVRGAPSIEETAFDGNSLFYLAEHTGGWLYENFNKIDVATSRLLARSTVTYVLSIQPEVEADGSFHQLEVRLRDGVKGKVFHRPAYRAPRPGERLARRDRRQDLTELVLADSTQRDFEIDVLTMPVPAAGGRARVPVVVEVPGEVLLAHPFGDNASVEIHAYGLDGSRGIQDLLIRRLDVSLERERKRLERGGLRFVGHLELAAGASEVRVLVRNLADDAVSIASVPVSIERLDASRLVMLPPVFIDRSRDWVSMAASPEASSQTGEAATLARLGIEFFPCLRPEFRGNRMQEVVVNFYATGAESPRLSVRVLGARGQEVATPEIRLVQRWEGSAGATGVLATLEGKGLEPGGYTLEVSLVDPASGERATSTQRFRIVETS